MKIVATLLAAFTLLTAAAAPSFAQRGEASPYYHNQSPASPNFGDNGY